MARLDAQEAAGQQSKLTPSPKSNATGNVGLLSEEWFVDNVLMCPPVIGAIRTLLGPGFGLPIMLANHRATTPSLAQGWHHDGDSHYGPEVEVLQVMYYPQPTPLEMGPTEVLVGSHFMPISDKVSADGSTFNGVAWEGGRTLASSAGTIFVTQYSIMHRRAASTHEPPTTRNMLKYCYYRQAPPAKDWGDSFTSPAHQSFLRTANFGPHYYPDGYPNGPILSANKFVAEMYLWLCGRRLPRLMGGQAWPATVRQMASGSKPLPIVHLLWS